jgi:hypothetical protein
LVYQPPVSYVGHINEPAVGRQQKNNGREEWPITATHEVSTGLAGYLLDGLVGGKSLSAVIEEVVFVPIGKCHGFAWATQRKEV